MADRNVRPPLAFLCALCESQILPPLLLSLLWLILSPSVFSVSSVVSSFPFFASLCAFARVNFSVLSF